MDPITIGITAIGLGMKIFGGMSASEDQAKVAESERRIAGLEGDVNNQKKQAMELSSRRQQMEVFRNIQRARAHGTNAAVSQGASYGSGMITGGGSSFSQGMFNSEGINQNLEIGRNIFGLDSQISAQKQQISQYKSDYASDQGIANIGGAIMGAAGTAGNIFGSAGSLFKDMAFPSSKVGI